MFLPETFKPFRVFLFSLCLLLAAGCFTGTYHPFSPGIPQEESLSLNYLSRPSEYQLSGGPKCDEEVIEPDDATKVKADFAELNFPEGCVTASTEVEACADDLVYAVDLQPHGLTFLLPVEVEFTLPVSVYAALDPGALSVMYISPEGLTEEIPFVLQANRNKVTIVFSIIHFSRYALVID